MNPSKAKASLQALLACAGMMVHDVETHPMKPNRIPKLKPNFINPTRPESVVEKKQRLAKRKRKLKRGF